MKTNSRYVADLAATALAPAIWGSTYIVTTSFLPAGYPLTVAMLRALPAGLLLLFLVRKLPFGIWWERAFVLGALNFSFFWAMLFVSAYRLPGGVAATVGAVQPLIVIALSRLFLGNTIRPLAVLAGLVGMVETFQPYIDRGELVLLLEDFCPPFPGFYLYYPRRQRQPLKLRALVDYLRRSDKG